MILIPELSKRFINNRMQMGMTPTLPGFVSMFGVEDRTTNKEDPSNCVWISKFVGDAIGWSAKLAIDADGMVAGKGFHDGVSLDPADGQRTTSYRLANGKALSSEGVPFYVLPGGTFGQAAGLELGDVGVVIYGAQITAAILGDSGPVHKIGEASIRVHNKLRPAAPDPCADRDSEGRCVRIHDVSIPSGVIAVFFKHSKLILTDYESCQTLIEAKAFGLWKAIGGVVETGEGKPETGKTEAPAS